MNEPLPISKLVALIGDENIQVQNILGDAMDVRDGKEHGTILFATDRKYAKALIEEGVGGESQYVGLVLWVETGIINKIKALSNEPTH